MQNVRRWVSGAAALSSALALAACGSSSGGGSGGGSTTAGGATTTPAANAAVAKLVPAAVKSKGTLTVAADATYAPGNRGLWVKVK